MSGQERRSDADSQRVSGVSRRRFVAGSLLLVGGSSALVDAETTASFRDSAVASGTVVADGDPRLAYQIADESANGNAQYQIAYQVEWTSDFDHVTVDVDNVANGEYNEDPPGDAESESFTSTDPEGVFSTSSYGGHAGDTFEFLFEVYERGTDAPVIEKTVTDVAGDGSGSGEGDFADADSPAFDWVGVIDEADDSGANYGVYYEISKQDEAASVEATFENRDTNATGNRSSSAVPEGSLDYSSGGADGDSFEITVDLVNTNGIVVDSVTFEDVADRDDPATYGDPRAADSPTLEWVVVRDWADSGGANYEVYYEVSNTEDFDAVTATFDEASGSAATESNPDAPIGALSYSKGGADGATFGVAVEALNAVGFPVDAVTVEDAADATHPDVVGDPAVSDSPTLDSFTVTDDSANSNTDYTLSYRVSNTDRFGGVRVRFRDTDQTYGTELITTGPDEPNGTVEYGAGGTQGDRYEITVEVLETRNGTTFPVDAGTLADVADGDEQQTWPEDAP